MGRRLLSSDKLFCPFCKKSFRQFKDYEGHYYIKEVLVDHFTKNALCPICHSDMRHRFVFQFLKEHTPLFYKPTRILHFAPEPLIEDELRKIASIDYITCDLNPPKEKNSVNIDMTNISFPDASFDAFLNIHVLEHIEDDHKAIRELYRILKVGGWGVIAIPIYGDITFEVANLDSEGRTRMYGIDQHVRLNGLDFFEKLQDVGFNVKIYSIDSVPGKYVDRTASSPHTESDKYLFYCIK